MTYLKSDDTPDIHENLPKRLDWMEDGIVNAGSAKTNDDTVYVAAPTGVAATDNAAIAAAIAACPTGGVVQLQHGSYAGIDAVTTSNIAIAKKVTIRGRGGADALWANYGTRITVDHATASCFSVSAHGVHFENLAIQNIHATAPTAGAGIETVSGGGNSTHYGPDLSIRGFYYNIDHQAGAEWFMDPSCFMYDFVYCGLRIQNVDSVDGGDMTVSGMFVAGPTNNATAAIQWLSGGGFKGYSIKTNVRGSATLTAGIDIELQDGVATSDFLLVNSSIENSKYGVLCEHKGPSNTGTFAHIVITGCQFFTNVTSATGIAIAPAVTGKLSRVYVGGNVLYNTGAGTSWGVEFQNIDVATHGPNVYARWTTSFKDNGGNTNIINMESAAASPLTTKGDLWGFGTVDSRLGVGTNGKILIADSAQTLGVGYSTTDLDAATHKILNVVDPVSAQDAATKNYVDTHGTGGTVDGIGTVTLVAGSNVTITDNSPTAGHITIASTGGGSGGVTEYDYVQITSPVTITGTTDATATAVIDGNAVTYDGSTRIKLEFFALGASITSAQELVVVVYDGATDLGRLAVLVNDSATATHDEGPLYGAMFLTPSAGAHTFHVKAWKTGGTVSIYAGAGGAGVNLPAWYRITKA